MKRKTLVVHRNFPHDIYCGRGSKYGNPFIIGPDGTREDVIKKHKSWIDKWRLLKKEIKYHINGYMYSNKVVCESLHEIREKRISCFCKPLSCHLDYIAELADKE